MQFTINGTEYEVSQQATSGRFFWLCESGDTESKGVFETALEAQQDAIRHAEENDITCENGIKFWDKCVKQANHQAEYMKKHGNAFNLDMILKGE